jgi:choline dehydrogenase-like flavoprotein
MMPGFGASHMSLMRRYTKMAVLTAMVHDEAEGRVTIDDAGHPQLAYAMSDGDRSALAAGLRGAARILLVVGASEVVVPTIPKLVIEKPGDVEALADGRIGPHKLPLTSVHPMGTLRMGDDPRVSAVKSTGEHHHVRGLFVLDGSLFPTSIGVPPQISIYAFSRHLVRHVVERAKG